MNLHERLFHALLRLMPAEFRGEYEREMSATFRAERRGAGGPARAARVWLATAADVVRIAPREHLDILRRDLSYTVRMLRRRPGLTLAAVLTLALGVGANTAIFSVIHGVLLAPLPYPDADRLVLIEEAAVDGAFGTTGYASFDAVRAENRSLTSVAAFASWTAVLAGDGRDAERIPGARVTWNYLRTLGLQPALGRDFEEAEDHPDRRRVAIIADSLWRRRYNADPAVIGQPVTINQVTYTVAGVMPADVSDLVTARKYPGAEIFALLGYRPELPQACRTCRHINIIGRLKDDTTAAQATADVARIYHSLSERHRTDYDRPRVAVTPVRDYFLAPIKRPLYLLWGAVGLLLLMACANVANLLLIRASERDEEVALRRALGVSPARLLRQLVTEALVLSVAGGAAGALLAWWATSALVANAPADIPRLDQVTVNLPVLMYACLLSVATGVVFGLAPARMLLTSRDVAGMTTRRSTAGPGAWRYRAALIGVNVAMSAVLLVGTGLLIRSFARLLTVDAGVDSRQVLTLRVDVTGQAYADVPAVTRFYDALTERLRTMPGVVEVSGTTQLPLTGARDGAGLTIEGRTFETPGSAPVADRFVVRPDYFSTLRIPLIAGRVIDGRDGTAAPPVAVIGRTMAAELWPGEDPLGRRIRVAGGPGNPFRTIVGIVGDVKHYGLHLPATMQVYVPHAQTHYAEPTMYMTVRVATDRDPLAIAAAAREHVRALDPLQPVTRLRTYDDIVAESTAARRFTLLLLALFGGTALLLAIVGLYGALSYVVTQRRREIGVRVALGARGGQIAGLVLRQGLRPAVAGVAAGLVCSLLAGRAIETMLYATSPRDAATYAGVFAIIMVAALAACLIPARSAAAVDPAVTLKAD